MSLRHPRQGIITEQPIDEYRDFWLSKTVDGARRSAVWEEYPVEYSAEHFIDLAAPSYRDEITILDGNNREHHPRLLRGSFLTRSIGRLSAVNIIVINNPRNQHRLSWLLHGETDPALVHIGLGAPSFGPLVDLSIKMQAPDKVRDAIAEYHS